MKITVDDLQGGAMPVYDTRGKPRMLKDGEVRRLEMGKPVRVPLYPVSMDVMRGVVATMELGEREGCEHCVLVLSGGLENKRIGCLVT